MATEAPTTKAIKKGIKGPVPGLLIQSSDLAFVPPDSNPRPIRVSPFYLNAGGAALEKLSARAKSFSIHLGGVLDGVEIPEAHLIDGAGTNAYAFDSSPYDNRVDSFYVDRYQTSLPQLSVLGFQLRDASINFEDLSNHPTLISLVANPEKSWLGRVTLAASEIAIPSFPQLTFEPQLQGGDAISASYDLNNGDLSLAVAKAEFQSKAVDFEIADSKLKFFNDPQSVSLTGRGSLQLKRFSPDALMGDLELVIANGKLRSARASVRADAPLSRLALSGLVTAAYDHSSKTGSLTLDAAEILGVGFQGRLDYTKKVLSGSLALNNPEQKLLQVGDFSLVPVKGRVNYRYGASRSDKPSGEIDFRDVSFTLGIGGQSASFTGDLSLQLDPGGTPSLASASLTLDSDLSIDLDGLRVQLMGSQSSAPTRLSLASVNGVLVPSLSGRVEFPDLSQLGLVLPEGGLTYGGSGWSLNDISLEFGDSRDLGSVRIGANAYARYQSGLLTVSPDLSINLDAFNLALKPIGELVNRYVTPVVAPIVQAFKTDIDLLSVDSVRSSLEWVKDKLGVDLPAAWSALVAYLEDYPGNPYKDSRLTAGELLDFTTYQAYKFVASNPSTAQQAFQSAFNVPMPTWLAELPAGMDFSAISMAATISRMERLGEFAAKLMQAPLRTEQWLSLPFAFQVGATAAKPELVGGEATKQQLAAALNALATQLGQVVPADVKPPAAPKGGGFMKGLPLQFNTDLVVPLLDDPLASLLAVVANQPFDLVRSDFSVSSGVTLGYGLPMATIAAPLPPLATALQAVNATLRLQAGLNAAAALSLGLTTTAERLGGLLQRPQHLSQTVDRIIGSLAGADPLGRDLGFFVGQAPNTPFLKLDPWLQAGLAMGRFGFDAEAYGRLLGSAGFTLTDGDGDGRLYLNDVLTGQIGMPGVKADVNLAARVGLKVDSPLGGEDIYTEQPIVRQANRLVATEPWRPQNNVDANPAWLMAADPWAGAS